MIILIMLYPTLGALHTHSEISLDWNYCFYFIDEKLRQRFNLSKLQDISTHATQTHTGSSQPIHFPISEIVRVVF